MFIRSILVVTGLLFSFVPMAGAVDLVTWGTAQSITGDSDVSSNGTLVYAYNLGSAGVTSTTVNGVQFSPWAFPTNMTTNTSTIGSVNFSENQGLLLSFNTLGTVSGAFIGLSSSYQTLLSSAGTSDQPNTLSLTLSGLTPGNSYQIQWWLNNSALRNDPSSGSTFLLTTASATNSIQLNGNVGSVSGNLGQFAIGSFTASGTSAVIAFNGTSGSNRPMINAFQLRDVTSVPEPSTFALAAIASGTIALLSRRRAKQALHV